MEFDQREYNTVVLAALLHDVGKFVQRAQDNPRIHSHAQWGADWFQNILAKKIGDLFSEPEKDMIRSVISNHHSDEKYISLADAISSGMDGKMLDISEEEDGDRLTDLLPSIFAGISLSSGAVAAKYNRLACLGSECLKETFPVQEKQCKTTEYGVLLSTLETELRSADFSTLPRGDIVNFLYFLLWKYTWCMPSAAYKQEPVISLFDHLKATAAISGCLYLHQAEDSSSALTFETEAFCIVGGDISGIQSYIFNVLSQQGRVAKRLRARSLFVQLISEIACHRILRAFGLPLCNIIGVAGGNFYILAPNLKNTSFVIQDLQRQFDAWTLSHLKGELSISLTHVVATGTDLTDFNRVLNDKLKPALNIGKYRSHRTVLAGDGGWKPAEFLMTEVIDGDDKACSGCHKRPRVDLDKNEDNLCHSCFADIEIGRSLTVAKYIAFFDRPGKYEIFGSSFELWGDEDLKLSKKSAPYLILSLNDTEINLPVIGFKYLANHVPVSQDKRQLLTFDEIAVRASGDKLLCYLKADVDNLGDIIRGGFRGSRPSISRFSAFSTMMEIFFSGYLQTRLDSGYADIYTIFSGGDDFYVVGPWNQAIDFARHVRAEFSNYCGGNPDMKFSAGMMLAKPHEPLSFCSVTVDDNLKIAKTAKGKDSVRLFGQTLTWKQLEKVIEEAGRVIAWMEKVPPAISRGFAVNLREYAVMSRLYEETKDTRLLKFVPHLNNDIKRNLTRKDQEEARTWAVNLSPTVSKNADIDHLPYLKAIMEYVLTQTRR